MAAEHEFIIGGGEMGDRIRALDWSATPLGPASGWPQSLRSALSILLPSKAQIALCWGEHFVTLYNDAYRPVFGGKHPAALGTPISEAWDELWRAGLKEMFEGVVATGDAFWARDMPFFMERHGYLEETYFDVSYDPVRDESGQVGGLFCIVSETTARVVGERRLKALRDLARVIADARSVDEVYRLAADVLSRCEHDLPFVLLYEACGAGQARLAASTGLPASHSAVPARLPATAGIDWPLSTDHVTVTPVPGEALQAAPWPEAIVQVVTLPIATSGTEAPSGHLVVGISARRRLDDDYRDFLQLIASNLASAILAARRAQDERRQAESLAELDRAKTAFFTNISHEFRTPLALMLGPLEEALPRGTLDEPSLLLVHRNARRLSRLVNGLLDFARIQAGRLKAQVVQADLAAVTEDLVSLFRSAAERAGLTLRVTTGTLSSPVPVDLDMYEKIVSNLLSNAIKFTREGGISVSLEEHSDGVALTVVDTGIGVPEAELPRLFERFHRIDNAWSRTQEGSGIGLALLRDLVTLHGGKVSAASTPGVGTTIIVTLPRSAPDGLAEPPSPVQASIVGHHGLALAEEATSWASASDANIASPESPVGGDEAASDAERVVVVDDNEDMRRYLARLLSQRWQVRTACDGVQALETIAAWPPDLVISDVMMPRLDGFGLLAALREAPGTRLLPVMLVSARAGEEARIEALRAGADDHVVKPFSARELLARVESQLLKGRLRTIEREQGQRLAEVFEQAPVGIAVLRGPEHRFEFVNDGYMELIDRRDVRGLPIRQALPELAGQGIYELLDRVYTTGQVLHGRSVRLLVNDADGIAKERFFDFVYQPTVGPDRQASGIVVVVYDVSALTQARREADRANRAKDEFLAMLGHELRNPLAPIVTALHLMRLGGSQVFEKERAIVQRQTEHLVRLVDDLMDVSRIASGKVELRRRRLDLRDAIATAVEAASPALERAHHRFELTLGAEPLWVEGDPARLSQVFTNLLVNAAKYTPSGGHLSLVARREGQAIEVCVSDDGIGIAPESLAQIFDLFMQEPQSQARSIGGMGLGLAIVKSLVEAHGGQVSARSAGKGLGSEFGVVLPACTEPPGRVFATVNDPPSNDAARRILIVDHNPDAAAGLALALELEGFATALASDGPGALEILPGFLPHIVLVALQLPLMDGYELARHIRSALPQACLIAMSGYGERGNRAASDGDPFYATLARPVDAKAVLTIVERTSGRSVAGAG